MFLGILVLITALTISAVAIYYSVAGLVAIFAAASIPIMIMGGALEVGKLVTAVWLHRYWREAPFFLKTYLSVAVVVLMFITSMGIFGFLSKAHIEQTANAQEGVAQIERLELDIERQRAIIARAEERILDIESKGSNNDAGIQQQIDTEQQRIDSAYTRIQPAIDEQLLVVTKAEQDLTSRVQPLLSQAANIETTLSNLSTALANNEVRIAQGIVGVKQDGALGPNTSANIQLYRETEEAKRRELLIQVDQIRTAPQPVVENARLEIVRLRSIAEQQIADSDRLISRLRTQLGTEDITLTDKAVEEQQTKIVEANNIIDTFTQNKYTLQTEYRKLEAEVGPVKYLAEFIYGKTADQDLLESAVKWVIIVIIFVFDPLAVLLLIASQYTFEFRRAENKRNNIERLDIDGPTGELNNEIPNGSNIEQSVPLDEFNAAGREITVDAEARKYIDNSTDVNKIISTGGLVGTTDLGRQSATGVTDLHFHLTPDQQERADRYNELDSNENIKNSKQLWKEENPDLTIKEQKDLYIHGKIEELPWEGYKQNQEQSEKSIWSTMQKKE
jgi:hypothetical protein